MAWRRHSDSALRGSSLEILLDFDQRKTVIPWLGPAVFNSSRGMVASRWEKREGIKNLKPYHHSWIPSMAFALASCSTFHPTVNARGNCSCPCIYAPLLYSRSRYEAAALLFFASERTENQNQARYRLMSQYSIIVLLVLCKECGNEPRDSLKGSHKGRFVEVIPSFPTEHQQVECVHKQFGVEVLFQKRRSLLRANHGPAGHDFSASPRARFQPSDLSAHPSSVLSPLF